MSPKRKPNLIETDQGKGFYNYIFQSFLNNNNNKHYSRITSLGGVCVEKFRRTFRDPFEKKDFEKKMVVGLMYYLQ